MVSPWDSYSYTYIYIYKNQFLALLQVYPSWVQQIDIAYKATSLYIPRLHQSLEQVLVFYSLCFI